MYLVFLIILLLTTGKAFYSEYYKRCRLGTHNRDVSNLTFNKVTIPKDVKSDPIETHKKMVQYIKEWPYINYKFIGAGASGQVFLLQNIETDEFKIAKRYFKEGRFQQQNYLLNLMGYPVEWTRDPFQYNTVALFPYTNSKTLYDVHLSKRQTRIVMYKIIRQLNKAHQFGFIHFDIKPLNILVDTVQSQFDKRKTQKSKITIIDWNLVANYYKGVYFRFRRGTACYQAPEIVMESRFLTPAVDVWSLGITLFNLVTGVKPVKKCSKDRLTALVRFVGFEKFDNFYKAMKLKYHKEYQKKRQSLKKYKGQIEQIFATMKKEGHLDEDLINLFRKMLQINPQERGSLKQLLKFEAFKNIRQLSAPYVEKQKLKEAKQYEL